ncbi:MAG: hypothetical protein JSR99_17770 [Proteobacteria bacterium]|nr:hypothetical protein [Pseudomonadota bacterium]
MIKRIFVFSLFILIAAGLTACSDEQPPRRSAEQRSGLAKVAEKSWLTLQDDVRPEVWLIEHEENGGVKSSNASESAVRRALAEASAKFRDSPRMIANRAVQLEGMLKEEGGDESAIVLISRLNGAIAPNRIESFGAAGQQYYNMRKAGLSEQQAIDALSKLYGSAS